MDTSDDADGVVELTDRITVDSKIMVGKPVIRGTRLPVEFVLRLLGDDWTEQDIIDDFHLTHEDILACLQYGAKVMRAVFDLRLHWPGVKP